MKKLFRFVKENPVIKVGGIYTAVSFWDSFVSMAAGIFYVRRGSNRPGDISYSMADVEKARELLRFEGKILLKEGLKRSLVFYRK